MCKAHPSHLNILFGFVILSTYPYNCVDDLYFHIHTIYIEKSLNILLGVVAAFRAGPHLRHRCILLALTCCWFLGCRHLHKSEQANHKGLRPKKKTAFFQILKHWWNKSINCRHRCTDFKPIPNHPKKSLVIINSLDCENHLTAS